MKRFTLFLALISVGLSGCVTSTVKFTPAEAESKSVSGSKAVGYVESSNWGLFLFNCTYLPLSSGNYRRPNTKDYHMFSNWIKPGYIRETMLARGVRAGGERLEDVEIKQDSTGLFSLFTVWRRDISGHATVVKGKPDAGQQ